MDWANNKLVITFDADAETVYIYLCGPEHFVISHTRRCGDYIHLDIGPEGSVVGIELLGPDSVDALFSGALADYPVNCMAELERRRAEIKRLFCPAAEESETLAFKWSPESLVVSQAIQDFTAPFKTP